MSERSGQSATPALAAPKGVIFGLQHLRALAAILVVIRHASVHSSTGRPGFEFNAGQIGVDIFFVISGVVIYMAGRNQSWDVFLRKRIARIVPLYWLVSLLAIAATIGSASNPYWLPNALGSLAFIPVHDSPTTIWPPIMAGWTLNFEMYFYAVCTLVLLLAPKRQMLVGVTTVILVGIAAGSWLTWPQGARVVPAALILLLPISIEFIAGMWLAHLWTKGFRTPTWLNVVLLVASAAWVAVFNDNHPYEVSRPLIWGPVAAAVVWAILSSEERLPFARWRSGLLVGDSSYALYLIHPIVLTVGFKILEKLPIHLPQLVEVPLAVVASVIAGVIVHKWIELYLVAAAGRLLGLRKMRQAGLTSVEAPAARASGDAPS